MKAHDLIGYLAQYPTLDVVVCDKEGKIIEIEEPVIVSAQFVPIGADAEVKPAVVIDL